MGALTARTKAFAYRSWEAKTFVELDETEITRQQIRMKNLKMLVSEFTNKLLDFW